MKVVLDTNVLLSGIFWTGTASQILDLWAKDKIRVVVSPEILEEYERLLKNMDHRKPGQSDFWRLFITQYTEKEEGPFGLTENDEPIRCVRFRYDLP